MVTIDLIGLLTTIFIIGLRYPHYVLLAIFIHELSQIFLIVITNGQLEYMVTAGVFGTVVMTHSDWSILRVLLLFSGSMANYIVSSMVGGIEFEPTKTLLTSWSRLKSPFSVINFRFCIISCLVQIWKNFI